MRYKLILYFPYNKKTLYFLKEFEVYMYLQDTDTTDAIRIDLFNSDIKDICTNPIRLV